jgi:hypothetical protein
VDGPPREEAAGDCRDRPPANPSGPSGAADERARGPGGAVDGGRALAALGLADAPYDNPLMYPGVWPRESGLLVGDRLLPLDRPVHDDRVPVLAVGSNACPAQLRLKLDAAGLATPVPMVRCRVRGVEVGVSAHVSRAGYVAAAPVRAPGVVRELFLLWLDAGQLAAVDAGEGADLPRGNYRRVWLPAPDVEVEPEGGAALPGVFGYVDRHGVVHDGTPGSPRRHPGQRALLTELLLRSARLRALFGDTPEEFCARARADAALCARGTRVLAEEGLVTGSGLERYLRVEGADGGRSP